MKPPVQTLQPTKSALKQAYQLVTKDLFSRLVKAQEGDRLNIGPLGALGSFSKNERKVKSGIVPRGVKPPLKPKLNTYVYYRILFKPSKKLKEELNKPLVKKYSR